MIVTLKHDFIVSESLADDLKRLSETNDDATTDEGLKKLSSFKKIKRKPIGNNDNLDKILSKLPSGIYSTRTQLINEINKIKESVKKNPLSYSIINHTPSALSICTKFPYSNGNIISGRNKEVEKILLTLSRKDKRGVIIVGDPGVGKTSIVKSINSRIREHRVPDNLKNCELNVLDLNMVLAKFRDDPLSPIMRLLEAASADDSHILFVDEVHQMLNQKLNDVLKPYLTEKIRLIGSTTVSEFHEIVTNDPAIERRFTIIYVKEPSVDETISMVKNTKSKYEEFHSCIIPDDVCKYLVVNGSRFLGHRRNPDKSFDILDNACTIMNSEQICERVHFEKSEINSIETLDDDIKEISSIQKISGERVLTIDYINKSISGLTGIDYNKIKNSLNYNTVLEILNNNIYGQENQMIELANTVNIVKHVKHGSNKPLMTMLLVGTSGIGKTKSLEVLSDAMFGSKSVITLDLNSMREGFSLSTIKGAPPGYVGYGKPSKFLTAIRTNPQSIIHFKNIDKCHPDVLDYIITSVKSGLMIDSMDKETHLSNAVIAFSVTLTDDNDKELSRGNIGFTKVTNDTLDSKLNKMLSSNITDICDVTIKFDKLSSDILGHIFDSNVDSYIDMYTGIEIDITSLKNQVVSMSKNGHDVISKISSEIPKMVFKQVKI